MLHGVGAVQRQRFFAKHLLARGGAGDDLRRMQRMRRRQQDCADCGIGKYGVEVVSKTEMMFGAEIPCRSQIGFDAADDF